LESIFSQVAAANSSENTLVIASSVGALAGLGFAFYRKSSVGGYIGYFILGSIVGSLIAHVIKPKTSTENTSPKNASKTEQSGNKKKLLDVLSGYSDGLKAGAIDKLSEGAITAGFVMLDSAIKYKNNKAKSIAENDTRIKNDYGVDINSSQFSKDIAEFWEQVA
jgi:uncharacterized membrane protein YeaQ/YmgE (transglycosylase-associated protein family)